MKQERKGQIGMVCPVCSRRQRKGDGPECSSCQIKFVAGYSYVDPNAEKVIPLKNDPLPTLWDIMAICRKKQEGQRDPPRTAESGG